jgi:hypothetical protein
MPKPWAIVVLMRLDFLSVGAPTMICCCQAWARIFLLRQFNLRLKQRVETKLGFARLLRHQRLVDQAITNSLAQFCRVTCATSKLLTQQDFGKGVGLRLAVHSHLGIVEHG